MRAPSFSSLWGGGSSSYKPSISRSGFLALIPTFIFITAINASPIRPRYDQQGGQPQQDLLTMSHLAIGEIDCASSCIYQQPPKDVCADNFEKCQEDCATFTTAYWNELESCIKQNCVTETVMGMEYVQNMKRAVGNHCTIVETLLDVLPRPNNNVQPPPSTVVPEYNNYEDPRTPDRPSGTVRPSPPCDDPKKPVVTKKPNKHKDIPPPLRKRHGSDEEAVERREEGERVVERSGMRYGLREALVDAH